MTQLQYTTSAPGKLILIGEYAVLEQAPALVMAVNRTANVVVTPTDSTATVSAPGLQIHNISFKFAEGRFSWQNGSENDQHELRFFKTAVIEALQAQGINDLSGFHFALDTSEFFSKDDSGLKFGFGSSASLTYAIVAAISKRLNPDCVKPPEDLLAIASSAHYAAQQKLGSGIDVAAAAYGGLIEYQLPEDKNPARSSVKRLNWPMDLHLCCVFSGKSVSTRKLVAAVYELQKTDPHLFSQHMQQMNKQSSRAIKAIENENTDHFVELADAYGLSMQQLGEAAGVSIMSAEHLQLKQLANNCGAAYKPSGAGGGDIGIALSSSREIIKQTTIRFGKEGFLVIDLAPYYHEI